MLILIFLNKKFRINYYSDPFIKQQKTKKIKIKKKYSETDNEFILSENNYKVNKIPNKKPIEINPEQARENQLTSLLNWKNLNLNSDFDQKENYKEFNYIEIPKIANAHLEKYACDIQALLINPPWSNEKETFFDFETFVI